MLSTNNLLIAPVTSPISLSYKVYSGSITLKAAGLL